VVGGRGGFLVGSWVVAVKGYAGGYDARCWHSQRWL